MHHARLLIVTGLTLLAPAGCQTSLKNVAKATTGQLAAPNVPDRPQSELVSQASGTGAGAPRAVAGPLHEPSRDEAFAAVLGDLQQIGVENPAAQQALLAQLAESDPAHWEALVTRMKSTMQYHEQLVREPQQAPVMTASAAGHQHAPDAYPSTREPVTGTPSTQPAWPSSPFAPPPTSHPATSPATQTPATQPPPAYSPPQGATTAPSHDGAVALADAQVRRYDAALTQASTAARPEPEVTQPTPTTIENPHAGIATRAPALTWRESLDRAVEQLRGEVNPHPQTTPEAYQHVRLRLLQLAAGNVDDAAAPPPGLTAAEQQYWSHQLLTISTLLDQQEQPEVRRRAAAGGLHLENAVAALGQLGSLSVGRLTFCEEVYGFGAYKALESARFKPGQEVKVYAEVANFKTVETPDGQHTVLATSYKVLDQHGGRVDGGDVPIVEDYCASRRRDFHITYGITLPKGIYPGRYVLELTLVDQLGDKIGNGSIDFEIAGAE